MPDGTVSLNSVQHHYETHLAPVYQWMAGGWDSALERSRTELDEVLPGNLDGRTVVDLGAGIGLHAIPLARRGCRVLAVDTSADLLGILRRHGEGLPIRTEQADLLSLESLLTAPADIILCMGDTLTHLPDLPSIEQLLQQIASLLTHGGLFVATFRDYTDRAAGTKRFINVSSDADRIMTCFLEYTDGFVNVHDLLHEREGAAWTLSVGAYQKVRLAPAWVQSRLSAQGLCTLLEGGPGGMVRLVARKT